MTAKTSVPEANEQPKPVLALTTASSRDEAEQLANLLVEEGLAACVNLVPGLHSIYRWQGAIESATEVLLIMKTSTHLLKDLERTIAANHSYQVPEFLVVPILSGSESYLNWLTSSLR
jgi:periplasmic divalent cation tolerance protein